MLNFFRRFGSGLRKPTGRSVAPSARLTLERLEDRLVPSTAAPTGLVATGVSPSAIALTWNASTDPTVTGYDVYEKVWINGVHSPRGSGGTPGHYAYVLRASNLTTPSDTLSGLATGSTHDYVVTALSPSGQSPYSAEAIAETWIAPSFPNGPNTFLLSSGALFSGTVNATAGLTTQLSLLVSGNPLTFSVLSGPPTVSIDPHSGVVTYTPATSEAGPVSITFEASNPLGAVTQTIQFNVTTQNPNLATPTLRLYSTSSVYNGQYQQVSATAVGTDGVTPVAGSYTVAYNGGKGGAPLKVGTYQVLVTFTSADPNYGNATLLTNFTITPATPTFNYLSAPTIAVGAASTTVSGTLSAGTAVPNGDSVAITINGISQIAKVNANGTFSTSFATGALPAGNYTITYAFAGDPSFNAAVNGTSILTVVPLAVPVVTLNPTNHTVSAGDGVTFTATATGSPVISVQWQVSIDGGLTFTNVTGNTSALTTAFSFFPSAGQNGSEYRAVFTNSAGTTISSAATLTVQTDTGGGGD